MNDTTTEPPKNPEKPSPPLSPSSSEDEEGDKVGDEDFSEKEGEEAESEADEAMDNDDSNDEDAVEDGDTDDESTSKPKRKKRVALVRDSEPHKNSRGLYNFTSEEEVEEELWVLAKSHFGGMKINDLQWVRKNWWESDEGKYKKRVHWCAYALKYGCQYRVTECCEVGTGIYSLWLPTNIQHSGHDDPILRTSRVAPKVKALISSPTVLRDTPSQFLERAQRNKLILSAPEQKQVKKWYNRHKRKAANLHLHESAAGTYGALAATLEQYKKSVLQSTGDFTEHTTYLVADQYVVDSEHKRHLAVLSTENLLLNAYRQFCCGQDIFLAIDTSYRYTVEGYGMMPIMVVSMQQVGHRVAYAVVSHEDEQIHEEVFRILKHGVEEVVNSRVKKGHTHV